MSSFDKVVKLACKPKAAPPKTKYLDPIIAATWSEDGAVYDVCKALIPRLREPNAIVVFKALIVLHTMIRNGSTDNVLSHLSSSEILRLRNISAGNNWEGYHAPQNLQHYALYLDSRIRAFRELKHDAIRVQSETNRDMRVNNSIEEDMAYTTAPKASSSTRSKGPQRSKTVMGRKLRVMTVEKGLLRETKTVQKMIDSLVECRFYLDDLEDELTITALRMLVKDLLILFQACNEGVINVLEHYFEMSKYDAKDALSIYRQFCDQTERVMEYLGVAKKLQNLLNVPIPNLRHAPVSLARSLEEYLNDPNFEQNRIEYKANKEAADRNQKPPNGTVLSSAPPHEASSPKPGPTSSTSSSMTLSSAPSGSSSKGASNKTMADLLSSIEEEQPTANPPTSSTTTHMTNVFQPAAHNPFVQRQLTGAFTTQPSNFPPQLQMQPTGFLPSQPFQPGQQAFQPAQSPQYAPQHRPFSTFLQPQATGFQPATTGGFLQPQATGGNPFRQSMLLPQATGVGAFNTGMTLPFVPASQQAGQLGPDMSFQGPQAFALPTQPQQPTFTSAAGTQVGSRNATDVPARPASTPLTTFGAAQPSSTSPPVAQPVKTHQTGSRNPFGIPVSSVPPVPKPPTLLELSMGMGKFTVEGNQFTAQQPQPTGISNTPGAGPGATESISDVASSFAFSMRQEHSSGPSSNNLNGIGLNPHMTGTTTMTGATGSAFQDSLFSSFTPLSSQPTGATVTSSAPSTSALPTSAPLKPQVTGLAGLKPFKPTSSFGAALLESLPPIPQSTAVTPDVTGVPGSIATHTSTPSLPTTLAPSSSNFSTIPSEGATGSFASQPTSMLSTFPRHNGGSTVGVGLRPQATGSFGAANPFRATMFATSPTSATNSLPLPPTSTLQAGLSTLGLGSNAFSTGFGPSDPNALKMPAGPSLI
ncbi:ANTH domain-containing protein [Pisolithus marmoratus]|nr:ANTH domain-containing protein [Pisolithus marmoratus]